ncbi:MULTISPECIES: DEAD/DEAH box helicase [Pseudomonas]|uniref:DEAD/DEAH box helicase n=1 Tax=Pseudomonas TaxID=286 RepID=UPI0007DE26DA|nr:MULTISPECIES: DEAD/DEAH box helicase [Pseudomonas]ANI04232.1 heavy metal resistance protein CzcA [Pseudomonas putida SJTE-1]WNI06462.1 DEAD/DEAH box helicase [Pseudomonas putida]
MQRINKATAEAVIDFSGNNRDLQGLAEQQLLGAVALYNKLADHRVAYLADEVGMGKTYIGLGVAALMRHFNPGLRVLYLLPKNNVRDKWIKDYRAFVQSNYRLDDLAVKGLGGGPVTPFKDCRNLSELVQTVASGNERDMFLCTSIFSFALGNTVAQVLNSTRQFEELMPQYRDLMAPLVRQLRAMSGNSKPAELKRKVKDVWMQALGKMLPRFDLVVVDEAHNLRAGRESSDRNRLLATLLGDNRRIKRLLLLSATPFDRDLGQLRNQLALFGFNRQADLPQGSDPADPDMRAALSRLLVRRLNTLTLDKVAHTRNMYRREHRSGEAAEVKLTVAQKLFAALLQKKVSEHLQENCSNRFELGMLASFESYLPGEKNQPVEFDGLEAVSEGDSSRDAADRSVVEYLVDDYEKSFKRRPPHPKMDSVCQQTHRLAFVEGKKQLIFVRRVRSVSELKFKLEEAYDHWIGDYIGGDDAVARIFQRYRARTVERSHSLIENEAADGFEASASSDNFFTWFYRGQNPELDGDTRLGPLPSYFRSTLLQSRLFETNWVSLPGMPVVNSLTIDWGVIGKSESVASPGQRYRLAQYAYLRAVAEGGDGAATVARHVLNVLFEGFQAMCDLAEPSGLARELARSTLWDSLRGHDELRGLAPQWSAETFTQLATLNSGEVDRLLRRLSTHQELLGVLCRVDHPFIDLYSLRHARRERDGDADGSFIAALAGLLTVQQADHTPFSSYQILRDTAQNLDLLIKLNFPEVYSRPVSGLTKYLASQVRSTSPIRGATGENSGSRTAIAALFRMPGYPRVLVSTDVFQEGEDLHTFCDSVVHYGISSSPIALEQKVGRVDRVGSLAHRRMHSAGAGYAEHFIQVGFPHIRQSMEFYQVRQAAANMNAFIQTLHAVGQQGPRFKRELELHEEVVDQAPVQPQILDFLTSHYEITDNDIQGDDCSRAISYQADAMKRRLAHVKNQLGATLRDLTGDPQLFVREAGDGWHLSTTGRKPPHAGAPCVTVRSAVGMAELLVSATLPGEIEDPGDIDSPIGRVRFVQALQADPFRRLSQVPGTDSSRRLAVQYSVDNYAGSDGVLIGDEILDVYQRASGTRPASSKCPEQTVLRVHEMVDRLVHDTERMSVRRLSTWRLEFCFKLEGRYQLVRWGFKGQYVMFSAKVVNRKWTRKLATFKRFSQSPLVEHTLGRNARFELVDFHVDHDEELSVRACHPVQHLNEEELMYIAHQVASQADRLGHVLMGREGDIGGDD